MQSTEKAANGQAAQQPTGVMRLPWLVAFVLGAVACAASRPPPPAPTASVAPSVTTPPPIRVAAIDASPMIETDAGAEPDAPPLPDFVVNDAATPLRSGGTLAAPCVDPRVHAGVTFALAEPDRSFLDFAEDTGVALDLDGDKTKDVFVDGGASRWETTYYLYVRRGTCGYFVGIIPSSDGIKLLPTKTRGLSDLRVVNDDCPSLGPDGGWCAITYRFDGTRYRIASETKTRRPARAAP